MKRIVLGAAALLATATQVRAADYPYPPPPPPAYAPPQAAYTVAQPLINCSWAGPYLGGNLGYSWGSVSGNPTKPSGFVGGIQGGYNWQYGGPFVFGIEGDLQVTGADDTFAPWKFSNPWFGTIRARAGYSFNNNVMFYATAGLAFGELRAETFGLSETHSSAGWTAGVGTEFGLDGFGFARNWTAKVEYLYVDLSENNFSVTGASNGYRFGVIRAGVNYHF
jgi:outer membrane immunogenic protein